MKIYTIGHSVHSKERFIDMLTYANIKVLADVRRFPASRDNDAVIIYASWNGATELASWQVLAGSTPHNMSVIA